MLGKLAGGMSAILGDEMGLGKTIQTAVFLQASARCTFFYASVSQRPPSPFLRRQQHQATVAPTAAVTLSSFPQLAAERGLTTGPVAVVVPLSTFGSWEREMAK